MAVLTKETRTEIARRYFDRIRNGETVTEIASSYGITREWVRKVAHKEAPSSEQERGEDDLNAGPGVHGQDTTPEAA